MGNEPTKAQRIDECIADSENTVSDLKSQLLDLERDERRLTAALKKFPRDKTREIRSTANRIAHIRVRQHMVDSQLVTWETLEQEFRKFKTQYTMKTKMQEGNALLSSLNEEQQKKVSGIIDEFGKNLRQLGSDQEKFTQVMSESMGDVEQERDDIVTAILKEHDIKLQAENQQLGATMQALPQSEQIAEENRKRVATLLNVDIPK